MKRQESGVSWCQISQAFFLFYQSGGCRVDGKHWKRKNVKSCVAMCGWVDAVQQSILCVNFRLTWQNWCYFLSVLSITILWLKYAAVFASQHPRWMCNLSDRSCLVKSNDEASNKSAEELPHAHRTKRWGNVPDFINFHIIYVLTVVEFIFQHYSSSYQHSSRARKISKSA
jgi:hypothetical protein